ncbi:MAG: hypothetical protein AAGB93_13170 [Planctomycetota bacterium]
MAPRIQARVLPAPRALLAWLVSLPAGAFFIAAATYKAIDPSVVTKLLALLPYTASFPLLVRDVLQGALVGVELYVGLALVVRRTVEDAALIGVALLGFFSFAVAPFYEALGGDCGCVWRWVPFSPERGSGIIGRNFVLAGSVLLSLAIDPAHQKYNRMQICKWLAGLAALSLAAGFLWVGLRHWRPPGPTVPVAVADEVLDQDRPSPSAESGPAAPRDLEPLPLHRSAVEELLEDPRGAAEQALHFVDATSGVALGGVSVMLLGESVVYSTSKATGVFSPVATPTRQSGPDGRLSMPVEVLESALAAFKNGYGPVQVRSTDLGRTIALDQSPSNLVVVDRGAGGGLEGAVVGVRAIDLGWEFPTATSDYVRVATTDGLGRAQVPGWLARGARILVSAPGRAIAPATWEHGPLARTEVELHKAVVIEGRVTPVPSGSDLRVRAVPAEARRGVPVSTHVASDGRFAITATAEGVEYGVQVTTAGAHGQVGMSSDLSVSAPERGIVLRLPGTCRLVAKVTTVEGASEAGPPMILTAPSGGSVLPGAASEDAVKGAEWSWHWPGVRPSSDLLVPLWIKADGFAPRAVGEHRLQSGKVIDLGEIELTAEVTWSIHVFSSANGSAIEGAEVLFTPYVMDDFAPAPDTQHEFCGANGRCALFGAPEGGTLIVRHPGYVEERRAIDPGSIVADSVTEVHLSSSARIHLSAIDADETPAPGASIGWRHSGSKQRGFVKTDHRGQATIEVPSGDVELLHSPRMIQRRIGSMRTTTLSSGIEDVTLVELKGLEAGEVRSVEVEVEALATLVVHVVDGDGDPQPDCGVWAMPGAGISVDDLRDIGTISAPSGVTGPDGRTTLFGVAFGQTTFFVEGADRCRRWAQVEFVEPDVDEMHLSLDRDDVTVRFTDGANEPVVGVEIEATIEWGGKKFVRLHDPSTGLSEANRPGPKRLVASTDAGGLARFHDVPLGCTLTLQPADPARFSTTEPVAVDHTYGSDAVAELTIGSGSSLMVQLPADDYKAAIVWLQSDSGLRSAATDANGEAHFHMLAPGDYSATVMPHGWRRAVSLEPGESLELPLIE